MAGGTKFLLDESRLPAHWQDTAADLPGVPSCESNAVSSKVKLPKQTPTGTLRQGPADQDLLHLRGALVDLAHAHVAVDALHREVAHVAVAAVHLDGV